MLVHAVVQVPLDRTALGIHGLDEAHPGGAKLIELGTQSFELLSHLDLSSLHGG
jgi:hypothetical protein